MKSMRELAETSLIGNAYQVSIKATNELLQTFAFEHEIPFYITD